MKRKWQLVATWTRNGKVVDRKTYWPLCDTSEDAAGVISRAKWTQEPTLDGSTVKLTAEPYPPARAQGAPIGAIIN